MKKLKIFLTGGKGFIGRNILELLGNKHDFLHPDRHELDLTNADLVLEYIKKNNVDIVLHAASVGGKRNAVDPAGVSEMNLRMFFNLARANKFYKRMIVVGSGAEYDKRRNLEMVSENDFDASVPQDQYGFAKYVMSKYAQQVDFITHLRIFGIYGKYEDYTVRFISDAICKTLSDLPISVKQNVNFDYIYIKDFVAILDHIISNPMKHIFYNVATGTKIDLLTLAKIVEKVSGSKKGIILEKSGMNNEYTADNSRLMGEMPGFSFTSPEKAITELFDYYKNNIPPGL